MLRVELLVIEVLCDSNCGDIEACFLLRCVTKWFRTKSLASLAG